MRRGGKAIAMDGFDTEGLGAVLRTLLQVQELFEQDHEELLHEWNGSGEWLAYNMTCGGTAQLAGNVRRAADRLVQALGFAAVGLEDRARTRLRAARAHHPVGNGLDRLARPLRPRTVEGLNLLAEVGDFFEPWLGQDTKTVIEAGLRAPAPTWPPADWNAYQREEQRQKENGTWPGFAVTRTAAG